MRHFVGPVHNEWDTLLDNIEYATNDPWQESTQRLLHAEIWSAPTESTQS